MENMTAIELLHADTSVIDLLPPDMAQVTHDDAQYHGDVRSEWIELNQIETARNGAFHSAALAAVAADLPSDAVILEIGSGVGYDASRFMQLGVPFGCYILSEISPALLEYAKSQIAALPHADRVRYCCLDASHMLIASAEVDRVLAVAAIHHIPVLDQALAEIDRITRPGARIIFAIEPNRFWSSVLVALRPMYRRLFASKSHSAADEEAEGFRRRDLVAISERYHWKVERIVPVWFFTGFLHLALESVYRLLRLRRRFNTPTLERICLWVDSIFFKIPLADRLAWHYSAVFSK